MTQGMEWSLIMWGIVTGILLILLFYRSTLTRQEDDQLFIDESSSSRATEQSQLIAKVNKINRLVKLVGATSGLMILVIPQRFHAGQRSTSGVSPLAMFIATAPPRDEPTTTSGRCRSYSACAMRTAW